MQKQARIKTYKHPCCIQVNPHVYMKYPSTAVASVFLGTLFNINNLKCILDKQKVQRFWKKYGIAESDKKWEENSAKCGE